MFTLAEKLTGGSEAAGWIALLLFQIHPLLALYSVQFGSEALFTTAILLVLYTFTLDGRKRIGWSAAAGALAAMIRPTALVFLPAGVCLILLLELIRAGKPNGVMFGRAAVYAGLFLVLLLPLGLRNLHTLGHFTLTGYLGGFNLYIGNNRNNMEAYRARTGQEFLRFQTAGWNDALKTADEMPVDTPPDAASRIFTQKALDELKSMSAGERFSLFAGKAWHFLRPYPMPGIHAAAGFWLMALADSLLMIFGIWGMAKSTVRRYAFFWTSLMIIGSGFAAHTLVHVYMRHRVPFMIPILCLFSASVLSQFRTHSAARKQHSEILEGNPG